MNVTIICLGQIGGAIGPLLVRTGYEVTYVSDHPDHAPSTAPVSYRSASLSKVRTRFHLDFIQGWGRVRSRSVPALVVKLVIDTTNINAERAGETVDEVARDRARWRSSRRYDGRAPRYSVPMLWRQTFWREARADQGSNRLPIGWR